MPHGRFSSKLVGNHWLLSILCFTPQGGDYVGRGSALREKSIGDLCISFLLFLGYFPLRIALPFRLLFIAG